MSIRLEEIQQFFKDLQAEMSKVIVGQEQILEKVLFEMIVQRPRAA